MKVSRQSKNAGGIWRNYSVSALMLLHCLLAFLDVGWSLHLCLECLPPWHDAVWSNGLSRISNNLTKTLFQPLTILLCSPPALGCTHRGSTYFLPLPQPSLPQSSMPSMFTSTTVSLPLPLPYPVSSLGSSGKLGVICPFL